jgi:excisionase family DNA binding protein
MIIEGYFTMKNVAENSCISVGRVQQLIATKRLPAEKVGQTNLVKESDLKLVESRKSSRPKREK